MLQWPRLRARSVFRPAGGRSLLEAYEFDQKGRNGNMNTDLDRKSAQRGADAKRMMDLAEGKPLDLLPSQLDFVPYRLKCLLDELEMTFEQFDDFSCNHFCHVFPLTESCYYSSGSEEDEKTIQLAVEKGAIEPHPEADKIYDCFKVSWLKNPVGVRDVDNSLKDKDLDNFQWPNADLPGIFDHLTESLQANAGKRYVVGLQHLMFHERAFLLLGYEELMLLYATEPAFVEEVMDRILEFQLGLAKRYIDLGVDAVRIGDDYGSQLAMQMSPKTWRTVIKPRLAKVYDVYHAAEVVVMQHSCGNIVEIIPDLIEIGLDILHPVQPKAMSIERLGREFGKDLAFHGGIDTQELLPFGNPQEVKDATKQCVDLLGANRRYIIAPSQEIMNDVPTENILALIEAIKDYR